MSSTLNYTIGGAVPCFPVEIVSFVEGFFTETDKLVIGEIDMGEMETDIDPTVFITYALDNCEYELLDSLPFLSAEQKISCFYFATKNGFVVKRLLEAGGIPVKLALSVSLIHGSLESALVVITYYLNDSPASVKDIISVLYRHLDMCTPVSLIGRCLDRVIKTIEIPRSDLIDKCVMIAIRTNRSPQTFERLLFERSYRIWNPVSALERNVDLAIMSGHVGVLRYMREKGTGITRYITTAIERKQYAIAKYIVESETDWRAFFRRVFSDDDNAFDFEANEEVYDLLNTLHEGGFKDWNFALKHTFKLGHVEYSKFIVDSWGKSMNGLDKSISYSIKYGSELTGTLCQLRVQRK
jgi:hypothetical protein